MTKLDNLHNVAIAAKNLRVFREKYAKLSRPKFAALLGIPPTTLKNYELGYREVGTCIHHGIFNRYGVDAMLFVIANVALAEPSEGKSLHAIPVPAGKVIINGGFVDPTDVARFKLGIGDNVAFSNYSHNQYMRAQ